MNNEELLQHLIEAKKAHLRWIIRAKALVKGIPIEKEQIPVEATECAFGRWFYTEHNFLNTISSHDELLALETAHTKLHEIYHYIFKIYFDTTQKGLLQKLFGQERVITPAQKEEAQAHLRALEKLSEEILTYVNKMESYLTSLLTLEAES